MKLFRFTIVACLVVLFSSIAHATITVTGIQLDAIAGYGDCISSAIETKSFTGTSIPTVPAPAILDVTVSGGPGEAYSRNSINWSVNGSQTIMSFDMNHKTTGSPRDAELSFRTLADTNNLNETNDFNAPHLTFTADADATYEFSGFYNATVVGASYGDIYQFVILSDMTDGYKTLFRDVNTNPKWLVEESISLTLGDEVSEGSLTGNLIAGHIYELVFEYELFQERGFGFEDNNSWTAVGNLTLKINEIDSVPNPLHSPSVLYLD